MDSHDPEAHSKEALQTLAHSRALWNRDAFALESDEMLAQILDRGSLEDWRALYSLLEGSGSGAQELRGRISSLLDRVPTLRPRFWQAVLAGLGHPVDWSKEPKQDSGAAEI